MIRRDLLSGVSTVGVSALVGCLDDGSTPGDDGGADDEASVGDGGRDLPIEVETIDAPGSEAGTAAVPQPDRVLVVNFTRTLCPTSEGVLSTIGDARTELDDRYDVGDDGTVRFLSVVNPTRGPDPSAAELAEWWDDHDGAWPIGFDHGGGLTAHFEIRSTPTLIAIDGEGEVHWRERNNTTANTIVSGVERAIEAAFDDRDAGTDAASEDDVEDTDGAADEDDGSGTDGETAGDASSET